MSRVTKMLPALFPEVTMVRGIPSGTESTISSLCDDAGIGCRVTGPAAERTVHLLTTDRPSAWREPGPMGRVAIGLPDHDVRERAIQALGILAYAVFDYAARESMRGRPESRQSLPPGRPAKVHPLDGATRTRNWRLRRA
jgi:hypothetical protein